MTAWESMFWHQIMSSHDICWHGLFGPHIANTVLRGEAGITQCMGVVKL